ncbi:MAG: DUF3822 family protein [Bacteroidales bacterium]
MSNAKVRVSTAAFDKAIESEASEYYRLSIQLSQDGFSFCLLDTRRNKYLGLQAFSFMDIKSIHVLNQVLNELIQGISWLRLPYELTRIIYNSRTTTLIPEVLFDPDHLEDYLRFNANPAEGNHFMSDHLPLLEARNIWCVPSVILKTLQLYFPSAGIHHHGSALLESLLLQHKHSQEEEMVFANIHQGWFDIVILRGGKLLFYNTFDFAAREDFIYYLIYVLEQLQLNPETVSLVFTGEVLKISALYDIAYKYVRKISFATRNPNFEYSYAFDDIPAHLHFTLLNLQQCEL